MKTDSDALFYTCSLIEYIARITKNKRNKVVDKLGDNVERIYKYQDVFHCEPIEKVADDFIRICDIKYGDFDNVAECKYEVPDYWDIGEVFKRLIEDNYGNADFLKGLREVYSSWIADKILNFNSDLYYQSREYISESYKNGSLLVA